MNRTSKTSVFLKYLFVLAISAIIISTIGITLAQAQTEVVVLPQGQGFTFNKGTSGVNISAQRTVYCSSNADFTRAIFWRTVDTGGSATWTPDIPVSGIWDVYVYIPSYDHINPITVMSKYYLNGSTLLGTVDQNLNKCTWLKIGTVYMAAGTSNYIYMPSYTGENSPQFHLIAADGVKFVWSSSNSYTISGNVGIPNATITYTGGNTLSDGAGNYSFSVPYGWNGTITPAKNYYSFLPPNRNYTNIQSNQANQDFLATDLRVQVTVNQTVSQFDPTTISLARFTVVFDKPIKLSSFTPDDIILGGTASGAYSVNIAQQAPNDNTTFELTISGMNSPGIVTASVGAGAVTDLLGNPNAASTSTDNSVTYLVENDTACNNVPTITPGQDSFGNLVAADDIDPYKFDVTSPYTTIDATLSGFQPGADLVLYLYYDSCQDGEVPIVWGSIGRRYINIGRRYINIGPGDGGNLRFQFNVGKKTGTYYVAVANPPDDASPVISPYTLHLELHPPDFSSIDTLILYNPKRFTNKYGLEAASQLTNDLIYFANHSKVKGALLLLDQFANVQVAYDQLDATSPTDTFASAQAANQVTEQIRLSVRDFLQKNHLFVTKYIVIVGDDEQIPFRRLSIGPDNQMTDYQWLKESEYIPNLTPNTHLGAALKFDQTLTDDFYGDLAKSNWSNEFPQLAVGRLLDSPERIRALIQKFIDLNGVVDMTSPGSFSAVAGYDFLVDSAQKACKHLGNGDPLRADCDLIQGSFTSTDLSQKFTAAQRIIAVHYWHTNHDKFFAPDDSVLTGEQIRFASLDPRSALWWMIGCQSGLVVPDQEGLPISLVQALAGHGITTVGNTGWAWGADGVMTYSELLYSLFVEKLTRGGYISVGEALRSAKEDYYYATSTRTEKSQGYYHQKVKLEATLYGLPMLQFRFSPPAAASTKLVAGPTLSQAPDTTSQALPPQLLTVVQQFGNLQNNWLESGGYYTDENGQAYISAHNPVVPQTGPFEQSKAFAKGKGLIFKSGSYRLIRNYIPKVVVPRALKPDVMSVGVTFNGVYPQIPAEMFDTTNLEGTHSSQVVLRTGQFIGSQVSGTLALFDSQEVTMGFWRGIGDEDIPPLVQVLKPGLVSNVLNVPITVEDISGVYKAYLTYTVIQDHVDTGTWQSLEMDGDCSNSGQQNFNFQLPIPTTGQLYYMIQVMDCAGNVFVEKPDVGYYQLHAIRGNAGVGGAVINYTGGSMVADAGGNYVFRVAGGWNGRVTPSKPNYIFTPAYVDYAEVTSDQTGQNYIASAVPVELVLNGGLNLYQGTSNIPINWKAANFALTDGKSTAAKKEGIASVKIAGQAGKSKTLTQTLLISGSGEKFTFSFWAKGASIPATNLCRAQVLFYNGANLAGSKSANCKAGTYAWSQSKVTFTAPAAYNKIVIKFTYTKATGAIWLDWVSLTK